MRTEQEFNAAAEQYLKIFTNVENVKIDLH